MKRNLKFWELSMRANDESKCLGLPVYREFFHMNMRLEAVVREGYLCGKNYGAMDKKTRR